MTGIGIPIVRYKKAHNYVYLLVVGVMSLANAEVYLRHFGFTVIDADFCSTMMLNLIILMIVFVGGKVILLSHKVLAQK